MGYDVLNRPITNTDALGRITRFEYDTVGNRVSLTDPSGQTTRWDFDALNRMVRDIDALGAAATFAYDSEGNRIEAVDRSGRRRTFGYDVLNRLTTEQWWTGNAVTRTTTQTFDAVGNRLTVTDPDSRLTFTYDGLNRVLSVDTAGTPGGPAVKLDYQYDTVGNRTRVQDTAGARVDSFFDNRNLLTTRSWSGAGVADSRVTFGYDAALQRTQSEHWLGVTRVGQTTSGYDVRGWLTTHAHNNGSGTNLVKYTYAYDTVGQVVSATHHNQSVSYTYDLTGQMTRADFSAQADEDYTFDNAGNRTGQQRVTSTGHRLSADATFDYQYDANGNLKRKTQRSNGEFTEYTYDYRQRLVGAIRKSSGGIVLGETTFTYDALDRLIKRVTNGSATWTVYDGDAVWADYDMNGQVKTRYLTGDQTDEMLARWTPNAGVAWYLTDRQGTVRDLANAAGAIINHVDYSAFGVVLAQSNASLGDRFLYTGREYDAALALYWYRARWYDASSGRFTSVDPKVYCAGDAFNPYRYVGNAPANGTDPSGMLVAVESPSIISTNAGRAVTLPLARTVFRTGLIGDLILEVAAAARIAGGLLGSFSSVIVLLSAIGAGLLPQVAWNAEATGKRQPRNRPRPITQPRPEYIHDNGKTGASASKVKAEVKERCPEGIKNKLVIHGKLIFISIVLGNNTVPGQDNSHFRNKMYELRDSFVKERLLEDSAEIWEIGHIYPKTLGGTYNDENVIFQTTSSNAHQKGKVDNYIKTI
jgi:RHS repeat-associated protein